MSVSVGCNRNYFKCTWEDEFFFYVKGDEIMKSVFYQRDVYYLPLRLLAILIGHRL